MTDLTPKQRALRNAIAACQEAVQSDQALAQLQAYVSQYRKEAGISYNDVHPMGKIHSFMLQRSREHFSDVIAAANNAIGSYYACEDDDILS